MLKDYQKTHFFDLYYKDVEDFLYLCTPNCESGNSYTFKLIQFKGKKR